MLEIYTTGGGLYLEQTLNAIAAFFNTGNALALVNIALLVGCIILIFQIMFGGEFRQAIKAYVVIGLVGGLSVGHKSDVIIFDKTEGSLWFRTVDNVPTSVAYVGSFTSRVSNVLTTQIETLFSPPTNIAYQRHGMLFGATLMSKSARWRAVTSVVHENLTNFMDQCVIDAVELRYQDAGIITRTGDLEGTIAGNMPASLAYYDTATRSTRSCAEGWPDLVASINTEVDVVIAAQAASAFQGPDATAAINDIRGTIEDFTTFAGYAATSAEEHIKQAMLIAAFDDAANRGIAATGNAAALDHLQSARAEVQTRSSYQAVGANALSWVPYLKIVFENLYYGAFPIAIALMMTPFVLTVVRGYFGGFVWLASWEPLSAILHSLMMNATAERFQTITSASTSGAYTDSIMNWANHFGVYSIGQDVASMAGYLMMSIPFVAAAIFFGTQRMVGLATSMLAVSQSAASDTGREMSTGNLSYNNANIGNRTFRNASMDNFARNNVSFDNTRGNQHVTSSLNDHGRDTRFLGNGASITTNPDGTWGANAGSSRVDANTQTNWGNVVSSTLRSSASSMVERGSSLRASNEASMSRIASDFSSFNQSITNGEAFTKGRGTNVSDERRQTLSDSVSTVSQFASEHNVSQQTALEIAGQASAGLQFKQLSAGMQVRLQQQGVSAEKYSEIARASASEDFQNAVSDLSSAYQNWGSSASSTSNLYGDKGFREAIDDVGRQARVAENFQRAADSFSAASDRAEGMSSDMRVNQTHRFAEWLQDEKGFSPEMVSGVLADRGPHGQQAAGLRAEYAQIAAKDFVDPEFLDEYGSGVSVPNAPKAPARPTGELYDGKTTLFGDAADMRLDVGVTTLNAESAITNPGEGAPRVASSGNDLVSRVGVAQDNSLANRVTDRSPGQPAQLGFGYIDQQGYYRAENVQYDLQGKTRSQPADPALVEDMSRIASGMGAGVGVSITSAGQPAFGSNRTGSTRHNHGDAVDLQLTLNGQALTPDQAPNLYREFIAESAKEYPGIGHYDWGVHVGGGTEAFWGPDTTSKSANPEFREAYNSGRRIGGN